MEVSPEPAAGRVGLFSIVKAVAFVSVIVVVEIVAAAMLAPSAEETARLGQELAAAATGESVETHEQHGHGESKHDEEKVNEVELGIYNITRFNPATNTTLAIDFELYGTVLASDATEFGHEFEHSKARIREQVTMTLHGATSADLTDAGLGLIKRRILEKTNRALGQPLLKEVLFSKFSFVER
jgi:flagellar FliL protein